MTSYPERVVRFYGNTCYALDCLSSKHIAFIHATKLNDPFDPYFYFDTDFNSDWSTLCKYIKRNHKAELRGFIESIPEDNWNTTINGLFSFHDHSRDTAFVFSTCAVNDESSPKDNLYMWGHYGNGHRGVAIEFNAISVAQSVQKSESEEENDSGNSWFEINYRDDLPKITCADIFDFYIT